MNHARPHSMSNSEFEEESDLSDENQRPLVSSYAIYESAKKVYSHVTSYPVIYRLARTAEKVTEKSVEWSGISSRLQEESSEETRGLILIDEKLKKVFIAIDQKVKGYIDEPTELKKDLTCGKEWVVGTSQNIFLSIPILAKVVPSENSEEESRERARSKSNAIIQTVLELPGWACERVMAFIPEQHKTKLKQLPLLRDVLRTSDEVPPEDDLPPVDTVVEPDDIGDSHFPHAFSEPMLGTLPVITEECLESHNKHHNTTPASPERQSSMSSTGEGFWHHVATRRSLHHRYPHSRKGSGEAIRDRCNSFSSAVSHMSEGAYSWHSAGSFHSDCFHTPKHSESEAENDEYFADEATFMTYPLHLAADGQAALEQDFAESRGRSSSGDFLIGREKAMVPPPETREEVIEKQTFPRVSPSPSRPAPRGLIPSMLR